jgi:integrase
MKYVASIQGHRYGPVLQLVALTGMRRGELLGLSWKDVDFKAGTINIHRARIRAGNQTIFDTPKSKKSKRTIEIDLDTMQKLQAWKIAQMESLKGIRYRGKSPYCKFGNTMVKYRK